MAENLWSASNVISGETSTDGVYRCSGYRGLRTNLSIGTLTEDTLFHHAVSLKFNEPSGVAWWTTISAKDKDGKLKYFDSKYIYVKAGEWVRIDADVNVPSGYTVTQFIICCDGDAQGYRGTYEATGAVVSIGSPVTLASSAHTPYATQDHVAAEVNGMRDTVAPTEDAGAASRNYAVGEFFYDASHNLCRVTQAVSQGASLVSGTNYTTVSGGVQQYIGTPTYVYETAPSEATVKAAHATPCFVYVVDTASFYYVS